MGRLVLLDIHTFNRLSTMTVSYIFLIASFSIALTFYDRVNANSASTKLTTTAIDTQLGYDIPVHVINNRLGLNLHPADAQDRLFAIKQLHLTGQNVYVNLSAMHVHAKRVRIRARTIVVDGIRRSPVASQVYLSSVDGITVAYTSNRTVLSVWSDNMMLTPVDLNRHPGLYVNRAKLARRHTSNTINERLDRAWKTSRQRSMQPAQRQEGQRCSDRTYLRDLEVAIATDSHMCETFGGAAGVEAYVAAHLSIASAPFETQSCITLALSYLEIHCATETDPYRSLRDETDSNGVFLTFRDMWREKRGDVRRDVAHLLLHYQFQTGPVGTAWAGSCDNNRAFSWSETLYPSTTAHELAHNVMAGHPADGGIMAVSGKTKWKEPVQLYFSPTSVREIAAYVDRERNYVTTSSCITRSVENADPRRGCDSEMMACRKTKQMSIKVGKFKLALTVKQEFGKFRLAFKPKRVILKKLAFVMSINDDVSETTFQEMAKVGKTKAVKYDVPTDVVRLPDGIESCCDRIVYVHTKVQLCKKKNKASECYSAFKAFKFTVTCNVCGEYIPMSISNQCPVCQ